MSVDTFKSLIAKLHALLDDIQTEVIATIDTRNPSQVSPARTACSSESLISASKKFSQLSDVLATFAVDPSDYITSIAGGFHESNALRVVSELRVADALGTETLTMTDLAKKVDADTVPLRQCMRMLVNRGIFKETKFGSDVFANNRISSILLSAHENNLHGFIGHWCQDAYKAGTEIVSAVRTNSNGKTAFKICHGMSIWDYYQTPIGTHARERLNRAMVAAEPLLHNSLIYNYNWTKHGEEVTMIDVGGGIGGAAIEFVRRFPRLKVIIQDRASVLDDAPKFWDSQAPECKPRVTFMPHDFFGPQPKLNVEGSCIYFMRFVLHDWKDDDCLRILRPIVQAMKEASDPSSRLYIADAILDEDSDRFKHMVSLQMMTLVGALERTEIQFRDILGKAGLRIEGIWRNPGFTALIECTPAN